MLQPDFFRLIHVIVKGRSLDKLEHVKSLHGRNDKSSIGTQVNAVILCYVLMPQSP